MVGQTQIKNHSFDFRDLGVYQSYFPFVRQSVVSFITVLMCQEQKKNHGAFACANRMT